MPLNRVSSPISSPNSSSNLISPIPIRLKNVDAVSPRLPPLISSSTPMDDDPESMYSNVFRLSNLIGRKRRSESESFENQSSIQTDFNKLLDGELTRLDLIELFIVLIVDIY